MMFHERVIDTLEGLVGHFYACVNCARREDAEEGVEPLCKKNPSGILSTDADPQFRDSPGCFLKKEREIGAGEPA